MKLLSNPDIIFWKFFQLNNSKGVGIGKEVAAAIHFIFYPFYRKISCLSHRRSVLKSSVGCLLLGTCESGASIFSKNSLSALAIAFAIIYDLRKAS